MKNTVFAVTCLALATAGPVVGKSVATPKRDNPTAKPAVKPTVDMSILHIQVILDKLGFGPGVLDGRGGESLNDAVRGFQESRGLEPTGKVDAKTLSVLAAYKAWRPTKTLTLDAEALKGPFLSPFPKEPEQQAQLDGLHYRNALEALAERFHTTPETLVALNPSGQLAPGAKLVFPNALPTARDYKSDSVVWRARLTALNVTSDVPKAKRVVVDKSDRVLKVYDEQDRLVAQFPATMGSKTDPLPLGTWKILAVSPNPTWTYNPAILKRADKSDPVMKIPPGPNSPVGVVWIDLSKEHYGIHGTSEPSKIGRAESNGCIRLTNWDAARLSQMVSAGTVAIFQA